MIRMEVTKEMAQNFAEWFEGTLELQESAQPCIYYHAGRVDFSPGSITGGTAAPVYNGEADIIIDKEWWNEQYDSTLDEKAEAILETIQEFVESVEEEEEEEQSGGKLIGSKEVAEILGWDIRRVSVYKGEKRIPAPTDTIGGRPAWKVESIMKYAKKMGIKMNFKLVGDPAAEEWFMVGTKQESDYPDQIAGKFTLESDRAGWFTDEDSQCRIRVIRDGSGEWRTSGRWED